MKLTRVWRAISKEVGSFLGMIKNRHNYARSIWSLAQQTSIKDEFYQYGVGLCKFPEVWRV